MYPSLAFCFCRVFFSSVASSAADGYALLPYLSVLRTVTPPQGRLHLIHRLRRSPFPSRGGLRNVSAKTGGVGLKMHPLKQKAKNIPTDPKNCRGILCSFIPYQGSVDRAVPCTALYKPISPRKTARQPVTLRRFRQRETHRTARPSRSRPLCS